MNTAVAAKTEDAMPMLQGEVTKLTPMQMAYQLIAKGTEFSAVREMIEFAKKLEADEAEKAFNAAMAEAQAAMSVVVVNMTNSQTRSRYADYAQLDKALRPIYTKFGFALSFDEEEIDKPDYVRIVCHVSHTGGHSRKYHRDMPADGKGAKGGDVMTKTHAVGAASQYGMRYILRGVFNVATGEQDTDGNMPGDSISQEQIDELNDLIDQAVEAKPGTDRAGWLTAFLNHMKANALMEIPAKDFSKAKAAIRITIKQESGR